MRSSVTLEELFPLVPDLPELEELRLALVGVAVPDPARAWDSSRAYSTIDKRVVSADLLQSAVDEVEESLQQYVISVMSSLRSVTRAFFSGEPAEAAASLIQLGDWQEQTGRYRKARRCFEAALSLSLPLPDKPPQILALRRIGRVALALGDLKDALMYYRRSAELARHAGELHEEVVALTGSGNVLAVQGQGPHAERCYREALERLEEADDPESLLLQKAQLYNNLGMISTRQARMEEAEAWLQQALDLWMVLSSPVDLAVCYHNLGLLRKAQGRSADATAKFEQAMALDVPPSIRASIAIDLADTCLSEGYATQAKEWAREAEEHAITARSPYQLGHMYRGLGNIARASGDDDGFTFFEKALEIAREKGYPQLEGETLTDYALLRSQMGETDEARAYLERAREVFRELGAAHEQARAEEALDSVGALKKLATATGD